MARTTQSYSFVLYNSITGLPWSGKAVSLRIGALTYNMTEIGASAVYKIDSIPPEEYTVYVNGIAQTRTVGVGTGAVTALDYPASNDKYFGTNASGETELKDAVSSVTVGGSSQTGDVDLDSTFLRNEGNPTAGNLAQYNTDTQKLEDSGIDKNGLVVRDAENKTASFTAVANKFYKCDTTSGDIVVTLPSSGALSLTIFKTVSDNKITFSESINGDSNFTILNKNSSVPLFRDGTEYVVV